MDIWSYAKIFHAALADAMWALDYCHVCKRDSKSHKSDCEYVKFQVEDSEPDTLTVEQICCEYCDTILWETPIYCDAECEANHEGLLNDELIMLDCIRRIDNELGR